MRSPRIPQPRDCSIEIAMKLLGQKWAMVALREISFGQVRFDDIVFNTGAPRDILATRLKSLEAGGVIRRELYQERPARYEYHLTEAGEQLCGIMHAIRDWGDRFLRSDAEQVARFKHDCGAELEAEIRCGGCGENLAPHSIAPRVSEECD